MIVEYSNMVIHWELCTLGCIAVLSPSVHSSIRSTAYIALDCSSRAIPAGGGRDSAASKTDRSIAKMSASTSFHLCCGFCSSNCLTKSWQNICLKSLTSP